MKPIEVVVETGKKRTFASALDWPGWSRSGKDEGSALQALVDYGPRYARILQVTPLGFQPPADVSALIVVERSEGNATTDFGAPDVLAAGEKKPLDQMAAERAKGLLQAYWQAFDRAVKAAQGKELRKGPRGGGRDLDKITRHVLEVEKAYLARLAWKAKTGEEGNLAAELMLTREATLAALDAAAKGQIPSEGPRGGKLWPPRYFVRRFAWHLLDHTWEIEDRIIS